MRWTLAILAACGGGGATGDDDDGPGPDAHVPTKSGGVTIQTFVASNTTGGTASAYFSSTGAACTSQAMGACEVVTCPAANPPPPVPVAAGTVTVTGAAQAITLVPNTDGSYPTTTVQTPLYAGGETLAVSATGGDVAAFTGSVTAPAKAIITSPAKPPSMSPYLIVNRAQGLTVGWTGGGSGMVLVDLDGGTNRSQAIRCKFAASAGTGTVPASVLAGMPAGMGGFAMAAVAEDVVNVGDYAIEIEAYFNAVWSADSAIVSGPTTYQ